MNNNLPDNETAKLYLDVYFKCMEYKNEKSIYNKDLECGVYLNTFKYFAEKYFHDKNRKI